MPEHLSPLPDLPFLRGGGVMGEIIRNYSWSLNALGEPELWPVELKNMVSMMLTTTFPVLICWGADYIQLYNDAFRPINGTTKHPQALGSSAKDTYGEIWETIRPMFSSVMQGQTVGSPNFMVQIDRNGHLEDCYFDFSYSPIRNEQGSIGGVLVICMETTAKIKALQEAERARLEMTGQRDRLREFFMEAPAGICILDGPELVYELVNPLYQRLFPDRELLGKPILDAVPEICDQPVWGMLQQVYRTGKTLEGNELLIPLTGVNSGLVEDRYFNFIYQARMGENGRPDGILVFVIEVTDAVVLRKQDLAERKEAEEKSAKLAAIIESSDDAIISKTLESVITSWNDSAERIFGYKADEIIGQTIYKLIPDDRQNEEPQILARLNTGERVEHFETKRLTKDGRLIDVSVTVSPVKDKQGGIIGLSKIARDITEKKLDEQRKNDFIGMVSHELKTPLTSLTAILQVLNTKMKKSDDHFVATALERANRQVKKMVTLINGFLSISRLEGGKIIIEKQPFILGDLIKEVIEETNLTGTTHIIELQTCDKVVLKADRDKISTVLSNLLSNAVKYSPKGSKILVDCRKLGNEVRVSVTDEGLGIRPGDLNKIFERFYRVQSGLTRNVSGFGIGLYLSAEIIKRHNGQIWAESETGKGSEFNFSLKI